MPSWCTTLSFPSEVSDSGLGPAVDIWHAGLHYDVEKGLFLKVDSSHQVQLGTVYRGRQRLTDQEVLSLYNSLNFSVTSLEPNLSLSRNSNKMVQLVDIFSKPEMALMAGVMDYFLINPQLEVQPESLHYDVSTCIALAHRTFHSETRSNPQQYLHRDPELIPFLLRLRQEGKKMFVITNSPFDTVDAGMSYMVGHNWRELFEVIIVEAGKPHFFTNNGKPFREMDMKRKTGRWEKVAQLEKGKIYVGGTIEQFQHLTGWTGRRVMYFGGETRGLSNCLHISYFYFYTY